jgi:hypothetical protein
LKGIPEMNTYKVRIHIEEFDKDKNHCRDVGTSYEAGQFDTEKAARMFVENELMLIRAINTKLRNACKSALKLLRGLGKGSLKNFMQNLAACQRILRDAIDCKTPMVDDNCPKCGAGSEEREFTRRDFLDIDAIHVHYTCKKCGSDIIEEFTLTDVFIDEQHKPSHQVSQ